jgi:hypothetical protein
MTNDSPMSSDRDGSSARLADERRSHGRERIGIEIDLRNSFFANT